MKKNLFPLLLCFFLVLSAQILYAQNLKLSGTVYDYFSKKPLEAVTVQTTSGLHMITDSSGKFSISVLKKDSVWFSYLSKQTLKYIVDTISNPSNFEIALHVDVAWLPAVKVRNSNYRFDSLTNRLEYAKVFNFRKPGLKLSSPSTTYVPGGATVGLDLDEIINSFRFKRNRQILTMQERLIKEEQDKYINHRFTKYLVQKLTSLKSNELDSFMNIARPSYELIQTMNEIELGYYIQQYFSLYRRDKLKDSIFLKKEED
ncbi:MAG TPA: hypothetical protein PLP23_09985 [Panacibacter sp.]|nr:hypothetical protein [Panacibacter sp.]